MSENEEEFNIIKPELKRHENIPVRVIVSEVDLSTQAKEIKAKYFKKENDSKNLKIKLDEYDKDQLVLIKKAFVDFDADESGFIDGEEMRKIANSIGENPDTEEFKQAMLALDFNGDNIISFTEFVAWWKIGRQNTLTLPKIYQLGIFVKDLISKSVDYSKFLDHISEINKGKVLDTKSTQKIYLKTPGILKRRTFLELGLAIGGTKRTQMAIDFLSQFTKNTSTAKNNWISILISLNNKQNKVDGYVARQLIEQFKENLLKWGEENGSPSVVSFIKNLMLFEYNSNDKNVILVSRFKLDIEELVKGAIHKMIYAMQNMSSKNESFWFNLKAQTNCDLLKDSKATSVTS